MYLFIVFDRNEHTREVQTNLENGKGVKTWITPRWWLFKG